VDQRFAPPVGQPKIHQHDIGTIEPQMRPRGGQRSRAPHPCPGALADQPERIAGKAAVLDQQDRQPAQRCGAAGIGIGQVQRVWHGGLAGCPVSSQAKIP
jgi:hypothetical protein